MSEIIANNQQFTNNPIPPEFIALDKDLRFIKVKKSSKIPLESDWQNTNNYSVNDPSLIQWIRSGGNWGYFLRDDTDLCVHDADKPEELNEIIEYLGNTLTVQSGRDGRGFHILFRCPDLGTQKIYLKNNGRDIGDIRPGGTEMKYQTVGPGSIHPDTGRPYTIVNRSIPVEIDKEELLKLLTPYLKKDEKPDKCPSGNTRKITSLKGRRKGVGVGERNNYLFSYACRLREFGYELSEISSEMAVINREDCVPPVDAIELENVCRSSCRYPPGVKREIKPSIIPGLGIIRKYAYKRMKRGIA